jgi:hypothetical protein
VAVLPAARGEREDPAALDPGVRPERSGVDRHSGRDVVGVAGVGNPEPLLDLAVPGEERLGVREVHIVEGVVGQRRLVGEETAGFGRMRGPGVATNTGATTAAPSPTSESRAAFVSSHDPESSSIS